LIDTILPISSFNDTSADLILQEDVAAVSGGPVKKMQVGLLVS
jgi:hypothetical protein